MKNWKVESLYKMFSRKKELNVSQDTKLARYLTTLDLIDLGIGSTLGVGVYVLAGSVSKNIAGPAVIIPFAIASTFAGLCYAEFSARVPCAGSGYLYSYVTMGEFMAFLIGWTLILRYVIGSVIILKGLSTYVDALFNSIMRNAFESAAHIDINHFSSYPDFFAFGVTLIFSGVLAAIFKLNQLVNMMSIGTLLAYSIVAICVLVLR
ncbi:Low affinity cationic amino acid transporter 2 [Habropoda laboriosa]|uniref:Low affinity cationic amino acid transporter 2 n=1 Tax=Habropoda laboriosa TaxID=597456 RepID=A0A0L7QVM6_9HYME|nr:Low affinity cationic amino acid transporter 2 [Habropoda laboriosa]